MLLTAFLAVGLANVFGQKVETATATAAAADLEVEAPSAVRSGLIYQGPVHRHRAPSSRGADPRARQRLVRRLHDQHDEPRHEGLGDADGQNVLSYDPLPAGTDLVVRLQYQVNPTTVGNRDQGVALEDGGTPILTLDHETMVFP